mmetsp:Transcript_26938/g.67861  ORF Transcript_26938/g.67861 Transcript_26938/m.67861 type:complete len:294 (-) Transcript_26938:293-1174(-)
MVHQEKKSKSFYVLVTVTLDLRAVEDVRSDLKRKLRKCTAVENKQAAFYNFYSPSLYTLSPLSAPLLTFVSRKCRYRFRLRSTWRSSWSMFFSASSRRSFSAFRFSIRFSCFSVSVCVCSPVIVSLISCRNVEGAALAVTAAVDAAEIRPVVAVVVNDATPPISGTEFRMPLGEASTSSSTSSTRGVVIMDGDFEEPTPAESSAFSTGYCSLTKELRTRSTRRISSISMISSRLHFTIDRFAFCASFSRSPRAYASENSMPSCVVGSATHKRPVIIAKLATRRPPTDRGKASP